MKNIPLLLVFIFTWVMGELPEVQAFSPPYPYVLSQPIGLLPSGFVTINVGEETYYYCSGIFYQRIIREQKYVIVPPPIGAVIFSIPQGYELTFIDGVSYYEYQGVYYKRVLEGYKVIYPPV